jgi:hypothetical protein|tara:strand:+ start:30171 stop:31148 length:978 start_codon:yes stop_codon:yes gene_type:complete
MKPTLLLNPGTGWSATSPFHYTVTMENQYAHMGHKKENWYLNCLQQNTPSAWRMFDTLWEGTQYNGGKRPPTHPFGKYLSRSNLFIENTSTEILQKTPKHIDGYIEYFLGHYENVKETYAAVCDFSNANFSLDREFLLGIAPKLRDHFNVKVTMQFRDPVRRYFSEVGSVCQRELEIMDAFGGDFVASRYAARKKHKKLFFWNLKKDRLPYHCDYTDGYLKFCDAFGKENVYPMVMEDFWNPDKEKEELERLSNFLNYKITKIHHNCYVPDMGSNAPEYDYLKDQWSSDIEDLDEEDINVAGMYMGRFYKDWKVVFDELPDSWGK